jgi:hypothetical protein
MMAYPPKKRAGLTFWQTMMNVAVFFDVTRPSPPQKAMSTEYS